MQIALLHLSDMHLKNQEDLANIRIEALRDVIFPKLMEVDDVIIVVTGDIANHAKIEEYTLAEEFFNKLIELLDEKNIRFVFTPGNHDCYFGEEISGRDTILKHIIANQVVNEADFPILLTPQKNYNEFTKKFEKEYSDYHLFRQHYMKIGEKTILFTSINTSWMSKIKEKREIIFPEKELDKLKKDLEEKKYDLSISLFHHNYNWQDHMSSRLFKEVIDSKYNLILSGHEHCSGAETRISENSYTEHFEGKSLLGEVENGFSLIVLDIDEQTRKFYTFNKAKNDKIYRNIRRDDSWIKISIKSRDQKSLKNEFYEWLNLLELPLRDRCDKRIQLDDIYVYPQLQEMTEDEEEKNYKRDIKDSKDIINSLGQKNLFIGGNRCGKTSFSKMLFKHFLKRDLYPVYILGEDIKSFNIQEFEKKIVGNYLKQYNEQEREFFEQLNYSKRVIIIDDYNYNQIKTDEKSNELFGKIIKNYQNVFIIADESFYLEGLAEIQNKSENILDKLKVYKIREFGNLKRNELIKKWNNMLKGGCEENLMVNENKKTKEFINSIIKKNIIPSSPSYLLTSLNAFEEKLKNTTHIENTSYGYYYECIIISLLSRIKDRSEKDDIDSYFNFLKSFSYELFSNNKRYLKDDEMKEFHDKYIKEYDISTEHKNIYYVSELKKNLLEIDFLENNDKKIGFKYPYLYYFFLAKYLCSDDFDDFDIIKNISKNIDDIDNFNILLFIIYNKNTPKIFNEIINNVKEINKDENEVEFQEDINLINSLYKVILPKINLTDKELDIENNIKNKEMSKDAYDYEYDESEKNEDKNKDKKEEGQKLEVIFKHVELIGCILRSYSGSLKGNLKYDLCKEGYSVILRTLNVFINSISKDCNNIIENVKMSIAELEREKKIKLTLEEKEEEGKKIVFFFATFISYLFIRRTAKLLNNDRLQNIFQRLNNEYNTKSVKLIDLAINLEILESIPFEKLEEIYNQDDKNNILCNEIVRKFILDYLAFNPTKRSEKEKICNILNIGITEQVKIEAKNRLKEE